METPTFAALVSDKGRLQFEEAGRRALDVWLSTLVGKPVDVVIDEHKDTRSTKANRYYWSCVVKPCSDHTGDTPDDFHDEMCLRFLTRRVIAVVDRETGEADECTVPGRSSKLKIGDFYRFVESVRQFAATFLEVETRDPDPAYWRKRDEQAI